jgi:hypothetical protein
MVDYWQRLKKAMDDKSARDGKPFEIAELAQAMNVSYQAVAKVKNGGSFGKDNNIKAARVLAVSSDWLATGKEGPAQPSVQPLRTTPRQAMETLAAVLMSADSVKRRWIEAVIVELAQHPELAGELATRLETAISQPPLSHGNTPSQDEIAPKSTNLRLGNG